MASVKQAWIRKYGKEEGIRRWNEHVANKLTNSLENYIKKHGEEEGRRRYNENIKSQQGKGSLEYYKKKYGDIEGEKRYYEKNKRLSVSKESLRLNGYTEEQIEEIRSRHLQNSLNSKEDYIRRYGIQDGTSRYLRMVEKKKLNSKRTLEYWLRHHNGDKKKAKESLRREQSRNKAFFVRKYGKIEGTKRYEEHVSRKTKNWKNKKYNNSKGQIEAEEYVRSIADEQIHGAKHPHVIILDEQEGALLGQRLIYPDIHMEKSKTIIEYHGEFWHASERMFENEKAKHPYIDLTIEEVRHRDALKKRILTERGYRYYVIWEHDWIGNKNREKRKLKEFMNEVC